MKFLSGYKTILVSITGVLTGVTGLATGELGLLEGLIVILGALGLGTLRSAVKKVEDK